MAWRDALMLSAIVDATMALALTDHALGDPEQAIVALDELSDLLEEMSSWNFLAHVQGLRARIDLEQGDLEAASNTLKRIGSVRGTESSFVEEPRVTRIRSLLLHDTPASIVEAQALLQDLAPMAAWALTPGIDSGRIFCAHWCSRLPRTVPCFDSPRGCSGTCPSSRPVRASWILAHRCSSF